ncbi:VCBS repeat-containing protein, partial [Patescibacteria group bacterium]|nr:VCBS repeat-containing protein [Patescibacteria group bacterium]
FTVTTISGDIARTRAVDMSDYDNDGDLDIYVANLAGANKLYLNNGSGSFTPKSTPDATNRPGGV